MMWMFGRLFVYLWQHDHHPIPTPKLYEIIPFWWYSRLYSTRFSHFYFNNCALLSWKTATFINTVCTQEPWTWTGFIIALIPSRDGGVSKSRKLSEFEHTQLCLGSFKVFFLLNLAGNYINVSFWNIQPTYTSWLIHCSRDIEGDFLYQTVQYYSSTTTIPAFMNRITNKNQSERK